MGPWWLLVPGWGSGWCPGQCLDWGQVAQRSDQEDVDFLSWTEAAFCPAVPPGPALGICLPRPLSGDKRGQRRRGVSGLRSRPAALEPRGPQSSCTCVPRLPPRPGSVSGGPHCLGSHPPHPGPHPGVTRLCVAGDRESPGITPSSRNSEQPQGGHKCRTPPHPAQSGRGSQDRHLQGTGSLRREKLRQRPVVHPRFQSGIFVPVF